jgi:hypothetical protein
MPGGDRTGPLGKGSMTGRKAGYCAGFPSPGSANSYGFGRGFGRTMGRGFGRGFWGHGRGFWRMQLHPFSDPQSSSSIDIEAEKNYLENQLKNLKEEISRIQDRIKTLSQEK